MGKHEVYLRNNPALFLPSFFYNANNLFRKTNCNELYTIVASVFAETTSLCLLASTISTLFSKSNITKLIVNTRNA